MHIYVREFLMYYHHRHRHRPPRRCCPISQNRILGAADRFAIRSYLIIIIATTTLSQVCTE